MARLMPQQFIELLRLEDISTTMKFYVVRNAEKTADALWEAHEAGRGQGTVLSTITEKTELSD